MRLARRFHRILGLVLLLPILGWAATGFVFFVKPGYSDAYSGLRVREYPWERTPIQVPPGCLEARARRTALGEHLLVRTERGWSHLDAETLVVRDLPDEAGIRRLLEDAVSSHADRYGTIVRISRSEGEAPTASATTSTGAEIDLDWATLSLSQSGRDTRRIDALYRVHYLQWTGLGWLDRVLGAVGLGGLVALALIGVRLAFQGRGKASSHSDALVEDRQV